ncbi:MAG: hypothetical protein E7513_03480 [Ruminococcaceae bacterium]|nr:hypothetical protein [Oscillospiraceae bacterium]
MKKLVALLLAVIMCFALVACGGPDRQPAIDAFNEASAAFDALANEVNANPDAYSQEVFDTLNEMADVMIQHKELLEGDEEISQEKLDEMIAWYGEVNDWVASVEAELAAQ